MSSEFFMGLGLPFQFAGTFEAGPKQDRHISAIAPAIGLMPVRGSSSLFQWTTTPQPYDNQAKTC
ncbi:MAG: hypothetical protein WCZ86_09870 [Desulfurivibrionaceae bacterium]